MLRNSDENPPLYTRVKPDVREWVISKALADRRTPSKWIALLLEDAMNADRRKAKRAGT